MTARTRWQHKILFGWNQNGKGLIGEELQSECSLVQQSVLLHFNEACKRTNETDANVGLGQSAHHGLTLLQCHCSEFLVAKQGRIVGILISLWSEQLS